MCSTYWSGGRIICVPAAQQRAAGCGPVCLDCDPSLLLPLSVVGLVFPLGGIFGPVAPLSRVRVRAAFPHLPRKELQKLFASG